MTQSILIIGAERGLGLGLAQQFFDRGWDVTGTARTGDDTTELKAVGRSAPERLHVAHIDVTRGDQIDPFKAELRGRRFDIIYLVAGIFGPLHNSVIEASNAEFDEIMLTNCFGPVRLARHLIDRLILPGGTLAFMSSHRASIEMNIEPKLGLELYRASKAALNMLARGIYAGCAEDGITVLSIHPGRAATAMGTLNGTVEAEISVDESVTGVVKVLEEHAGSATSTGKEACCLGKPISLVKTLLHLRPKCPRCSLADRGETSDFGQVIRPRLVFTLHEVRGN